MGHSLHLVRHGFENARRSRFHPHPHESTSSSSTSVAAPTSQARGSSTVQTAHNFAPEAQRASIGGANHFLNALKNSMAASNVNTPNAKGSGSTQSSSGISQSISDGKDDDFIKKLMGKDGSNSQFSNDFIR